MAGDFNTDFNGDFSRVPYQGALAGELTFRADFSAAHGIAGALLGELTFNADFEGRTVEIPGEVPGGGRRRRRPPILFPVPEKKEPTPPKIDPRRGRLSAELRLSASFEALHQPPAPAPARPLAPARATLAGLILFDAEFSGVHLLPVDAGLIDDEDILLLLQAA